MDPSSLFFVNIYHRLLRRHVKANDILTRIFMNHSKRNEYPAGCDDDTICIRYILVIREN